MSTFKTSDFEIVTCDCFGYEWKKIKETNDESWQFDEIENGKQKTFRKMFADKKIIFHSCYSCMEKSIFMNSIPVRDGRYCLFGIKQDGVKLTDICNGCIYLLITVNKHNFLYF